MVSGVVKLTQLDQCGGESIVGLVLSGEWLGTGPIIANLPTPVTAVTCTASLLSRCFASEFRRRIRDEPHLSMQIHRAHAIELCQQSSRIGQLCSMTSRDRLKEVLAKFGAASGSSQGAGRFQLPLQQWELAEFVGVTSEHLSRLMRGLEQDGLIVRERGWIVLTEEAGPHRQFGRGRSDNCQSVDCD